MKCLLSSLLLMASMAVMLSQVTTSRLDGTVTDPRGATIVGAEVRILNIATGQTFEAKSDDRGYWTVASMSTGTYRVSVSLQGFKTAVLESVKIDAGVPATANVTLEIGALAETV